MTRSGLVACALGAALLAAGCAVAETEVGTTNGGACTSRYFEQTRADSRAQLLAAVRPDGPGPARRPYRPPLVPHTVGHHEQGGARVAYVEFVDDGGRGREVGGGVDVVRLDDGTWFAGTWGQCIDSGDGSEQYPSGWPSAG